MKKILFLVLFLNLPLSVSAVDLNWSLSGTASENLIDVNYYTGAIANINDDDVNTLRGLGGATGPAAEIFPEFECIVTFDETALTINKVGMVSLVNPGGGATGCRESLIYLYYSGAWNLVYTIHSGSDTSWAKTTHSQTGTWNNVTKIKCYWKLHAYHPTAPTGVNSDTFELRAWGPLNYTDIGLRVRTGSGTIKIGTQALDGHKLRIRKGGTTYGIPLITPGVADDSGVRIYDGSAVKALPKVD